MATARDIHTRPKGAPAPEAPGRDGDPAPQPLTMRDVEGLPEPYRSVAMAEYVQQVKARAEQTLPAPVPPPANLPAPMTADDREAAERFQQAAKAASKSHPAPGLHLTVAQLDQLRADDPDGFAAWTRAPRLLNIRDR